MSLTAQIYARAIYASQTVCRSTSGRSFNYWF